MRMLIRSQYQLFFVFQLSVGVFKIYQFFLGFSPFNKKQLRSLAISTFGHIKIFLATKDKLALPGQLHTAVVHQLSQKSQLVLLFLQRPETYGWKAGCLALDDYSLRLVHGQETPLVGVFCGGVEVLKIVVFDKFWLRNMVQLE